MTPVRQLIHARQIPRPLTNVFRGAIVIGGVCALVLTALWRAGFKIWSIDNANENEKRREFHRLYDVTPIPIAHLHTIDTLAAAASHPGSHLVHQIGNGNARDGLSALVAAGGMGGQLLVNSPEFQNLLHSQRSAIIESTNGAPDAAIYAVLFGMSGAVGAGSAIHVAKANEEMAASLNVPVEMHLYGVGGLAMTGFSDMAPINDAATRAALIDYATSKAAPNVIRHVHFQELPALGADAEEERTRLLLLDHQFLNSYDFTKHLQRISPNHGARCVFGNISFRHMEVLQEDSSRTAIRRNVVATLNAKLTQIKESKPITGLIKGDSWQQRTSPLSHASIDEIIDAHWQNPAKMQEDILRPIESHDPKLLIDIGSIGEIDVETIDHYMSRPLESERDIIQRKQVLESIEHHLARCLKRVDNESARFTSLIEPQLIIVKKLSDIAVKSKHKRISCIQKLQVVLANLRKLVAAREMFRTRYEALRMWISITRDELLHLNQTLASLTNCLADLLSTYGPSGKEQLAVAKPISNVLPDLLTLSTYSREVQETILDSLGALVTREGLARIVKAPLPTIDSIAMTIVVGTPDFKSPPLGAKSYIYQGPVLYVLPPVDANDMEPLAQAIKRHDANALVFFADSMDCGAAVARYRFRHFYDVESMFPGILRHDLERALNSDFALLRFPEGIEFLDRLGIVLDPVTRKLRFEPRTIVRY